MYLLSKIEEVVALLVPENAPIALPPPLDETGKTIMFAAELLRRFGWCQGAWFQVDGTMCAMGALYRAITGDPVRSENDNHPAVTRVIRYLGGSSYDGRGVVEQWNDRPGRKAGDVISMLESAARYVR